MFLFCLMFAMSLCASIYICFVVTCWEHKNPQNKRLTERAHFIWLVMIKMPFFTSEQPKRYKLWSCQKMCDALHYLLDNIFIRFGLKLYRQIVGIVGTNCAPLVADLFLFCYERDFMLSLSDNNQADIIYHTDHLDTKRKRGYILVVHS